MCLLEGEPGIGKTRLLETAMEDASEQGFRVLRGAGQDLARDRSFGPLLDALNFRLPDIAPAATTESGIGLPVPSSPDLRYRAVDALVQEFEALTAGGPALLVIDDLQWADAGTLVTIQRLVSELPYSPLAVLGGARPIASRDELTSFLDDLETRGVERLRLGPLNAGQLVQLAEDVLGGSPGPNLQTMLTRTGGNPFIALEMLTAARTEGLVRADDSVDTPRADIPPAARLIVLQRLSRLPQKVRDTIRLASILGTSFSPTDLAAFLSRPATELAPVIEEAVLAGELMPDGERVAFRHDIVRQAVYDDMAAGVRSALHVQAARALAAAAAPADNVATHFFLGTSGPDPEAIEWLHRAAREALPTDPPAAASLLERAIGLGPDPKRVAELRGELLYALLWSGRPVETIALGEDLLRTGPADPVSEARIRAALGTALVAQADWGRARDQFEAISDEDLPTRDRAYVLAQRAHMAVPAGDVAAAAATSEEARRISRDQPSPGLTVALHVQILVADAQARWSALPDLMRQAEAAQDGDPAGEARLWPVRQLGAFLCRADRMDEAEAVLRRGIALADEIGLPLMLHTLVAGLAWKEMYAGNLDEAQAHAETALRLGRETQSLSAVVLCLALLGRIAVHRGDLDRADEALEGVDREMARDPRQYQAHMAMWARALLAEARKDEEAAHTVIRSAVNLLVAFSYPGEVLDLAPDAVRIGMSRDDPGLTATVIEILEDIAEREGLASAHGALLQCRGLVDGDAGKLLDAVEAWRASERPLYVARAQEDAAATLASSKRQGDAGPLLEEAARGYEASGAFRELARCDQALRDLGIRRGARGLRRRPSSGWEALTKAEVRVVELAGAGLTNPQIAQRLFISRHTVKTHLGHAFQKLGVSSRLELVRAVARRG
jgi:DNA-binding CsgD family transcriptional regulator